MPEFPNYRYLGLDELEDRPHIIVDGAPRPKTSTVLSHWPISPTPEHLWRDLSAEIAYAYLLDEDSWDRNVSVVTNDHLDVDGLISLYFLTNPATAKDRAELLIDVARVGDFGVVRSSQAGEVAWALGALIDDPELAIVELVDSAVTRESATTISYRSLLHVLDRIIDHPELYRSISQTSRERFETSSGDIASGAIILEEHRESDLCVVIVGDGANMLDSARIGDAIYLGVDSSAIHSATDASRVLLCHGNRYVYWDRYETWVRYVSRHRHLRRDLGGFARELTLADGVEWFGEPPSSLSPVMHHGERSSSLLQGEVVDRLERYLATSAAAWDPIQPGARPDTSS